MFSTKGFVLPIVEYSTSRFSVGTKARYIINENSRAEALNGSLKANNLDNNRFFRKCAWVAILDIASLKGIGNRNSDVGRDQLRADAEGATAPGNSQAKGPR